MASSELSYPILRGVQAAQWIARFAASPISAAEKITQLHGPLTAFDLSLGLRSSQRLAFLAVGARFNESVLARPADYRAGSVLLKAKPGTALHRLGNGIFSRNDKEHRELRKAYAKPQSPKLLQQLQPRLQELVVSEVDKWPKKDTADLIPLVENITRRASIRFLLGDLDERTVFEIADGVNRLMLLNNHWATYALPLNIPGTAYRALHTTAERLEVLIRDLVTRTANSGVRGNGILSALLDRAGGQPERKTIDDIVSQIPTIFAASQETCKVAIPWTLFLLCQHPAHYRAVVDQIATCGQSVPSKPGYQRRDPLTLAIRESMRLLPSIPFVWRVARRPTDIDGNPVADGSRVLLSQYLTNRNPEIYPEPSRFVPDRWHTISPTNFEFADYSAGARRCIGLHFAEALQPIVISEILKARTLQLVDNLRVDHMVAVTLRPRGPLHAELSEPGKLPQRRRVRGSITELVAI